MQILYIWAPGGSICFPQTALAHFTLPGLPAAPWLRKRQSMPQISEMTCLERFKYQHVV